MPSLNRSRRWRGSGRHDVDQVYFKYCSTFDSTDEGNIGPVADALLDALDETMTLICPASPEHGRTIYNGHLFVVQDLLSESSMRHHPLTPMTDAKIARVLQPPDRRVDRSPRAARGPRRHEAVRSGSRSWTPTGPPRRRRLGHDADLRPSPRGSRASGSSPEEPVSGAAGLRGGRRVARTSGPPVGFRPARASCWPAHARPPRSRRSRPPRVTSRRYRLDPAATPDPVDMLNRALTWLRRTGTTAPFSSTRRPGPSSANARGPRWDRTPQPSLRRR